MIKLYIYSVEVSKSNLTISKKLYSYQITFVFENFNLIRSTLEHLVTLFVINIKINLWTNTGGTETFTD